LREISDCTIFTILRWTQFFNDSTNWFVPNAAAANAMIEAAGFDVLKHRVDGRYYAHTRVKSGTPPILVLSHEGMDYDIHARRLLGATAQWAAMD